MPKAKNNMSPYENADVQNWRKITEQLVKKHPLSPVIVDLCLKSWQSITITVEGMFAGQTWICGLEFDYANAESFYCRPTHCAMLAPLRYRRIVPLFHPRTRYP